MNSLQPIIDSRFLPFVEKPVRYIGDELNIVRKDLSLISLHGVLCFPETYEIGMSHFGLQVLYHIVNSQQQWALSRCFHPLPDAVRLLRQEKIPLYCLEYSLPLSKADWVGFTVQYELQYTNILDMLDLGGIPLFGRERDDHCPIIVAGGPCMSNPEPIADFIDAFGIGDGEETIVEICAVLDYCKKNNLLRAKKLEALSRIKGVYVPSLYTFGKKGLFEAPFPQQVPVVAQKIPQLRPEYYPNKPLVPLINVVHHRLAVEVMRGCTRGCRFCSAGLYYRPVRERNMPDIARQIECSIGSTGWREISLLSLSTADYSNLTQLLHTVRSLKEQHHIEVSIPSTRIDALTEDQMNFLDEIASTTSFTLAPEAGSMRLRKTINKDFSDETILNAVRILMQRNVQTLKLYFMIGLPTENAEDIESLVGLIKKIADMVRHRSMRRMVHVSISPFSPKPQTPFQWEAMDTMEVLMEKSRFIKQSLGSVRNVKVSYREPAIAFLETVMARGDRKVSTLIHDAWKNGAHNDGWDEYFNFDRWKHAAERVSIDMAVYASTIPEEQILPWSMVSNGVSMEFLADDRKQASVGQVRPDCRSDMCYQCGVCDSKTRRSVQSADIPSTVSPNTSVTIEPSERGTPHYYRYVYSKTGGLRFLGNRDMMQILTRAFIAAGIPLAFSKGFHAHPRISFGPPLPFGVIGLSEPFDIVATKQVLKEDLLKINRWLPEDLKVHNCMQLNTKEESLNVLISAVKYVFAPSFAISINELDRVVIHALTKQEILVSVASEDENQKCRENSVKNIRPLIYDICRQNSAIEAVLSHLPKATCRPGEFLDGVFPDHQSADFVIYRKECLKKESGNLIALWKDSI